MATPRSVTSKASLLQGQALLKIANKIPCHLGWEQCEQRRDARPSRLAKTSSSRGRPTRLSAGPPRHHVEGNSVEPDEVTDIVAGQPDALGRSEFGRARSRHPDFANGAEPEAAGRGSAGGGKRMAKNDPWILAEASETSPRKGSDKRRRSWVARARRTRPHPGTPKSRLAGVRRTANRGIRRIKGDLYIGRFVTSPAQARVSAPKDVREDRLGRREPPTFWPEQRRRSRPQREGKSGAPPRPRSEDQGRGTPATAFCRSADSRKGTVAGAEGGSALPTGPL